MEQKHEKHWENGNGDVYIYIHIHCLTKKHMETYNMYDLVMTNNFRTGSHERKKYDKNSHGCFQKYGDVPVPYVK